MKLLVVFALIPLALAAVPMEKRFFLENLIDTTVLSSAVHSLVSILGTDSTEAACEQTCHGLVVGGETALLHTFCEPICKSLQTLATHYGATGKRSLVSGLLNLDGLSTLVNGIIHLVGADPTEQACEGACHSVILGPETALLHTFCSPICHSLQALAQRLDHTPTEATIGKRAFLSGLIDTTALTSGLQQLLDFVGTDGSEQVCEMGCHKVVVGDETSLFHTFCTPICRSLQTLVHTFHLAPSATTTAP